MRKCPKVLGFGKATTQRAFQKAQRSSARSPFRLHEAAGYEIIHKIGDILDAWYREPAFLNDQGDPRPLPLTGLKSFATLAQRFLPLFDARDIADILIAERLLKRDSRGLVIPLRRAARFSSRSTLMLDRIPALLHALLSTLRHNARSTRRSEEGVRCERGTLIDRLPAEAIPAFDDYVRKLAHTLLNQTDGWASQRQAPESLKSRRGLARVGVEVFAYVETENAGRPGKLR